MVNVRGNGPSRLWECVMEKHNPTAWRGSPPRSQTEFGNERWMRAVWFALVLALCGTGGGCTAVTNPIADGIPVRLLPPEIIGPAKTNYETIPLTVLRQAQPAAY